ncbi:hypothetical protein CBR_g76199, partial [Chara braunii]
TPAQPSEPPRAPPILRSGLPSRVMAVGSTSGGSAERKADTLVRNDEGSHVALTTQDDESGLSDGGVLKEPIKLPAPWFIYAFLIAGIFTCLVTCTGLIGAETNSGCCLSCYSLGLAVLLMSQATLSAVIFLDDSWQRDFPADPTGEEAKAKAFIETHLLVCKWAAVAVLAIEIVGLLLALTLKAMQDGSRRGYDSDEEYRVETRAIRQPLLPRSQQSNLGTQVAPAGSQPPQRTDAWTTRMREKYGLDVADFTYNPAVGRRYSQQPQSIAQDEGESRGTCTIM